jgi:hypothetical protein
VTDFSKQGRRNRAKGRRRENEIVAKHIEAGIHAKRVSRTGTPDTDIDVYVFGPGNAPLIGEVKSRRKIPSYVHDWLADNDMLIWIGAYKEPLVILPWETWVRVASR